MFVDKLLKGSHVGVGEGAHMPIVAPINILAMLCSSQMYIIDDRCAKETFKLSLLLTKLPSTMQYLPMDLDVQHCWICTLCGA